MASNDLEVGTTVNNLGFILIQSLVGDLARDARVRDSFRSGLIAEEREIGYAQKRLHHEDTNRGFDAWIGNSRPNEETLTWSVSHAAFHFKAFQLTVFAGDIAIIGVRHVKHANTKKNLHHCLAADRAVEGRLGTISPTVPAVQNQNCEAKEN